MNNIFLKKYFTSPRTVTLHPFLYKNPSVRASLICQILVLIPHLILLSAVHDYAALSVIAVSLLASVLAEVLVAYGHRKHHETYAITILQGLLTGFLMPETMPLLSVFFMTFFVLLLAKTAFSAFADLWINPVAVIIAVAFFTAGKYFPKTILNMDLLHMPNVAGVLAQRGSINVLSLDTYLSQFLNEKFFHFLGVSIPEGYLSLLLDSGSLIPAFRFNFVTLISSLIIFSLNMISSLIPLCGIVVYLLLVASIGPLFIGGSFGQGDIIFAMTTSGTLFIFLFLASWYGTTPVSSSGKLIYGILLGIIAFFITGMGDSPVGMVYVILIANIISPLIQLMEDHAISWKLQKDLTQKVQEMREVDNV